MFRILNPKTVLVSFIFVLILSCNLFSQYTASPFLTICPSAEGIGMGNSGVAMVFDDAYGQWFNPGQLGLSSISNNVKVSYSLPVKWSLYSVLAYSAFGTSAGYNLSKELGIPLSLGAGYIRQFMDFGEYTRTDDSGNVLGKFKSSESADAFTVAAGIDYWLKIGFGLTYKHVSSNLASANSENIHLSFEGTANLCDIGILLSAPVLKDLIIADKTKINANINFGYSLSNLFDNMVYPDEVDLLPRTERLGYSIGANIHHNYKETEFELIGFDWSAQAEDELIKIQSYELPKEYENPLSNIDVINNMILLKSENGVSANYGFRISIAGTFKYMKGWMTLNTQSDYNTNGYEISSSGLLKYLGVLTGNSTLNYITNHFELAYVHANNTWNNTENNSFNRIYDGLNLKYKNFIF